MANNCYFSSLIFLCRGHIVFWYSVCGYVHTNVHPSVRMCVRKYIRDPVRLRLSHLYQVEFCSFIVRYPTAGHPRTVGTFLVFSPLLAGCCLSKDIG